MNGIRRTLPGFWRQVHTRSPEGPSETLKKKIAEIERIRKSKSPRKTQMDVRVPEYMGWLDTPSTSLTVITVGTVIIAKLFMMIDESESQERIEREIKNAPEGQGTVRMLTREEWDAIQDVRPLTPFESRFARANARIRTGEPVQWENLKDWSFDVLSDALTRAEEYAKRGSK